MMFSALYCEYPGCESAATFEVVPNISFMMPALAWHSLTPAQRRARLRALKRASADEATKYSHMTCTRHIGALLAETGLGELWSEYRLVTLDPVLRYAPGRDMTPSDNAEALDRGEGADEFLTEWDREKIEMSGLPVGHPRRLELAGKHRTDGRAESMARDLHPLLKTEESDGSDGDES